MKSSKNVLANQMEKSMVLTEEETAKLKSIKLGILIDLDNLCRENGLKMFLAFGTLLGAVRHKGYIPWDDDIDVMMPVEDAMKVKDIAAKLHPNKYEFNSILYPETEDPFPGIKMMLKGTSQVEHANSGYPCHRGIDIDIFPLIELPKGKKSKRAMKNLTFFFHVNAITYEYKHPCNLLYSENKNIRQYYEQRRRIGFLLMPLARKAQKKMISCYKVKTGSGNYTCSYTVDNDVNDAMIANPTPVVFEGHEFLACGQMERTLFASYGPNYMTPPPAKERESHSYLDVDFGGYK